MEENGVKQLEGRVGDFISESRFDCWRNWRRWSNPEAGKTSSRRFCFVFMEGKISILFEKISRLYRKCLENSSEVDFDRLVSLGESFYFWKLSNAFRTPLVLLS
ncbi:hypothetical protein TNIN_216261 [Trichonephila inaurata madagascariensis]|uniref:Uncharacterized protein n=1 Tax=Trichonephila inaurata madagascariensis TaxID=2747483 RepID=A0A8X6YTS9_9ARAC|nr:hypothetical protein TNIN_216261 [Trichonephila inaurata madagascariensis]